MAGLSSAAKMFARNSTMAQRVAAGLHGAASKVGQTPIKSSGAQRAIRNYGSRALTTMGNYPRRTVGGAAVGMGAMGMANRRRGSQNYPMY